MTQATNLTQRREGTNTGSRGARLACEAEGVDTWRGTAFNRPESKARLWNTAFAQLRACVKRAGPANGPDVANTCRVFS